MRFRFEKPVGSHADVKELEYISALHQSSPEIRRDATIDASDIIYMLISRFGLEVQNEEVVENEIIRDLAGDPSSRYIIDLRQTVSLLLLPHLRKCEAEGDPDGTIGRVAEEMKEDFQGIKSQVGENEDGKILLTTSFVIGLLAAHGEVDVPDELIEQMVEVAGGEGVEFDGRSLARALTQDLEGYNLDWENKWSTSYADILGAKPPIPIGRPGSFLRKSAIVVSGGSVVRSSKQASQTAEGPGGQSSKKGDANYTLSDTDDLEEPDMRKEMISKSVVRVASLSAIDNTADTFGSQTFAVLLWVAFLGFYVAYIYGNETGGINLDCEASSVQFGCQIRKAIGEWLVIFVKLILLGSTFFLFASMGNTVFLPHGVLSIIRLLIAMVSVAMFTIFPASTKISTWFFSTDWTTQNELFSPDIFRLAAAVAAGILLFLQLLALIRLMVPFETIQNNEKVQRWLSQGAAKKEFHTKRAAAFKVNRMVTNALDLRRSDSGNADESGQQSKDVLVSSRVPGNGHIMWNYHATSLKTEKSPGVLWAWKSFYSASICYEEGVWFHTRLLASAVVQILVLFVSLGVTSYAIWEVARAYALARGEAETTICRPGGCVTYYTYDDTNQTITNLTNTAANSELRAAVSQSLATVGASNITDLQKELFYEELENIIYSETGFNITSDDVNDFVEDPYGAALGWLVDQATEAEVMFGVGVGTACSLVSTLWVLFFYIPSFITSVQKFRYGAFPSLRDSDFKVLRYAPDHSTLAFGMAFWSTMFMAFFAFAVPGLIAFFFVWHKTATYVQGFVAQIIGLLSTLLIKVIILAILRNVLVAGFYRKRLAASNLLFMLLECWNIALSAGFLVIRTAIFLILSIFYIGRIDSSFLANEVDKFDFAPRLALDRAPVVYRKDLLLHEAHRHPYLDRLAALYLLKLNLGDSFATRAGSCWRLIFTLTLMPWLSKYRVGSRNETGSGDLESLATHDANPTSGSTREFILEGEVARLRAETARLKAEMADRQHPDRPNNVVAPSVGESGPEGGKKSKKLPEDVPVSSNHSKSNSKGKQKKKKRPLQDASMFDDPVVHLDMVEF